MIQIKSVRCANLCWREKKNGTQPRVDWIFTSTTKKQVQPYYLIFQCIQWTKLRLAGLFFLSSTYQMWRHIFYNRIEALVWRQTKNLHQVQCKSQHTKSRFHNSLSLRESNATWCFYDDDRRFKFDVMNAYTWFCLVRQILLHCASFSLSYFSFPLHFKFKKIQMHLLVMHVESAL